MLARRVVTVAFAGEERHEPWIRLMEREIDRGCCLVHDRRRALSSSSEPSTTIMVPLSMRKREPRASDHQGKKEPCFRTVVEPVPSSMSANERERARGREEREEEELESPLSPPLLGANCPIKLMPPPGLPSGHRVWRGCHRNHH